MSELAELDARGLLCPMPVIRTQDKIKTLSPGAHLLVTCTDPGTKQDIPAWCRVHGHTLFRQWQDGDTFQFQIVVAQ
ncbi:MAG: sulfurtransferase TusA family protein [Pseudomonadota bacterium]